MLNCSWIRQCHVAVSRDSVTWAYFLPIKAVVIQNVMYMLVNSFQCIATFLSHTLSATRRSHKELSA